MSDLSILDYHQILTDLVKLSFTKFI